VRLVAVRRLTRRLHACADLAATLRGRRDRTSRERLTVDFQSDLMPGPSRSSEISPRSAAWMAAAVGAEWWAEPIEQPADRDTLATYDVDPLVASRFPVGHAAAARMPPHHQRGSRS
jgi:hypothetical protein